jgi:hypothetical protein
LSTFLKAGYCWSQNTSLLLMREKKKIPPFLLFLIKHF